MLPSLPSLSRCGLGPQGSWALTKANPWLNSFLCWREFWVRNGPPHTHSKRTSKDEQQGSGTGNGGVGKKNPRSGKCPPGNHVQGESSGIKGESRGEKRKQRDLV